MISLIRVDSRLIHGQVIEAWLPHLKAKRIVVADDLAAADVLARTAMSLAIPAGVEVRISRIDDVPFTSYDTDEVRTLVLLRDVPSAVRAYEKGLRGRLNLGNVHAGPSRNPVSRTVFLTAAEHEQLRSLGVPVSIQTVPTEVAQALG